MPKVLSRCRKHQSQYVSPPISTSALISDSARIVSFEDNFPGCSASSSDLGNEHRPQETIKKTQRLCLARRKSSLSLVELAGESSSNSNNKTPSGCSSAPVSPISSPLIESLQSSPWGHFVEMQVPDDDYRRSSSVRLQVPHEHSCRCSILCRRQRVQPYGEYRRESKAGIPQGFLLDTSFASSFRLPRRPEVEQTQQLIGALDRLQMG